jgi:5-(carboxyamino)imidazole ribonucleotide synthase
MMMAEAAESLPVDLSVLAQGVHDPAVAYIKDHYFGSALDPRAVVDFGRPCDAVTVDHEVVSLEALNEIESRGVHVAPSTSALRFANDKAFQREEFSRHGFPLPEFLVLREFDAEAIRHFTSRHPRVVVKAARGGYDGRGVTVIDGDPSDIVRELIDHTPVLLEEFLDLIGEVAVSVVTGRDGATVTYPAVDPIQKNGMCELVHVPSTLPTALALMATELAEKIAEVVQAVGVLAVEIFVTNDSLLVNEVATRPHNSGHWSIEGSTTSQFSNHVRAVSGLPLGETTPLAPFTTMINVVGRATEPPWSELRELRGVAVHDYGKEHRLGRKLGHVTVLSEDAHSHHDTVETVRKVLAR